jgi:hypothetical protein
MCRCRLSASGGGILNLDIWHSFKVSVARDRPLSCNELSLSAEYRCAVRYLLRMVGIEAGLWGLFGGFAVEGLELYGAVRRYGRWPWDSTGEPVEAGPAGYAIAEVIRLLIGAGLAWAAAATGQVAGPLGALGVGVAAPFIIGQLAKYIPLSAGQELRQNADSFPFITTVHAGRDLPSAEPGPVEVTK